MTDLLAAIGAFLTLLQEFAPFIEAQWNSKVVANVDFLKDSKLALGDDDLLDISNQIDQANAAADAWVPPVVVDSSSQGST